MGVTRADLKHCGNMPDVREGLNRSVREGRIESRHSINNNNVFFIFYNDNNGYFYVLFLRRAHSRFIDKNNNGVNIEL